MGKFFNRMYYGDPRKPDLKLEDMPDNRFELFFTVLKVSEIDYQALYRKRHTYIHIGYKYALKRLRMDSMDSMALKRIFIFIKFFFCNLINNLFVAQKYACSTITMETNVIRVYPFINMFL